MKRGYNTGLHGLKSEDEYCEELQRDFPNIPLAKIKSANRRFKYEPELIEYLRKLNEKM